MRRPYALLLLLGTGPAAADLVFDGSLGAPGSASGFMLIGADRGTQLGDNLFHSFERFSVDTGELALFQGPGDVARVIARVTGTEASALDGLLIVDIPDADFFLFNPNGVAIGPGAELVVDGSLHLSTADALAFEDGVELGAGIGASSTLTSAAPASWGFLSAAPAALEIRGARLDDLGAGAALSLVAGRIELEDARIAVPDGRIDLFAAGGPQQVEILGAGLGAGAARGDVVVRNAAGERLVNLDTTGNAGGTIRIEGRNLSFDNGFAFADVAGTGTAGGVHLDASGDVSLVGGSRITSSILSSGSGASAGVSVRADGDLTVADATSTLSSNTLGAGRAGDVSVTATAVLVRDAATIGSVASGGGDAGDVLVTADSVSLVNGGVIGSPSVGEGGGSGAITIDAATRFSATGVDEARALPSGIFSATTSGDAGGAVTITAPEVLLTDGAVIDVKSFSAAAVEGGDVRIVADAVTLDGGARIDARGLGAGLGGTVDIDADRLTATGTGTGITAETLGSGDGGTVRIAATDVALLDGATVTVRTISDGAAGDIRIDANAVRVGGGATLLSETLAPGAGGTVQVIALDSILVDQGARVSSRSTSTGDAGDVVVTASTIAVDGGARLTSETLGAGAGGAITLTADAVDLDGASDVTAATSGAGAGGTVRIATESLRVAQASVSAQTTATGAGGSIELLTTETRLLEGARVQAFTSALGAAGDIRIDGLLTLDGGIVDARTLAAGAGGSITLSGPALEVRGGGSVDTSTLGAGDAGRIDVRHDRISIVGEGSRLASRSGDSEGIFGRGGDIEIDALEVALGAGGSIRLDATGTGFAGNLLLVADQALTMDDASIRTSSLRSGGGNIEVQVIDTIRLFGSDLVASASGENIGDDSGNVTIDPRFLILRDSRILGQANFGDGGAIFLTADNYLADVLSLIDATSARGNDGSVRIVSPDNSVSASLVGLDVQPEARTDLLVDPCAVPALRDRSTVTVERSDRRTSSGVFHPLGEAGTRGTPPPFEGCGP